MEHGYVKSFYVTSDDAVVLSVSNPDGNDLTVEISQHELNKIFYARQKGGGDQGPIQTATPGW